MQEYDIYSFIRSQEIREHFRKYWKMTMEEQVQLIARSYEDIPKKVDVLRWLASQSEGKDRALADQMADYLDIGYQSIVHPQTEALYIASIATSAQPTDIERSKVSLLDMLDTDESTYAYFTCFTDMIGYMDVERDGKPSIHWEIAAELINFPFREERRDREFDSYSPDWRFWVAWVDGEWIVRGFEKVSDRLELEDAKKWYIERGVPGEVVELGNFCDFHALAHRFTLPYDRGCRLKLQTPLMEKPLIGIYDLYFDKWGEHNLFLCDEDSFPLDKSWNDVPEGGKVHDDLIIIAYQMITGQSYTFCLWDWLERA